MVWIFDRIVCMRRHEMTKDEAAIQRFGFGPMVYPYRFHLLHSHDGYGCLIRVHDAFEMPGNGLDSGFAARGGTGWNEMKRCIWQSRICLHRIEIMEAS